MSEKKVKTEWKFRKLCSDDMFLMFKILGVVGINKFKKLFETDDVKKLITTIFTGEVDEKLDTNSASLQILLEVAQLILCNIGNAKEDIYQMLANCSSLKYEDIKKMPMTRFAEMFIEFVKMPDFGDFIQVVLKLFN